MVTSAMIAGCGGGEDGGEPAGPANRAVRERLAELAPANLGHRGLGPTRPLGEHPENSLAAFRAAIEQGADGIELDVVLTADGELLVMHDDRLDRTTTCRGCANAYTLAEAQRCVLRGPDGHAADEVPPSLADAYAAVGSRALVNVELMVFSERCADPATDAGALARAAAAEVRRLGATHRTIFSSFDRAALAALKDAGRTLYAALLVGALPPFVIDDAVELGLDAVHPFFSNIDADFVAAAHAAGLQVNPRTVNTRAYLIHVRDLGVDAIITDEPVLLRAILDEGQGEA
jgi:glycerophosphoryl diester phosphodiesterase